MSGQLGQAPEPAQHGSFLAKSSVAGRKVEFIQQSSFATSSFTVSASSNRTLRAILTIRDDAGNILDFEEVMGVYHYLEIYIDTNLDYNYEFGDGDSLSVGQKKVTFTRYNPRAGDTGSIRAVYFFVNADTSDHTIYIESIWNYIEIA